MYYCQAGEILVVNALYDELHIAFFSEFELRKPYLEALDAKNKCKVEIPHGTTVLALEASVPPFYEADQIRCLWGERVVFVKRKALEKPNANNCPQR